MTDGLTKTAAWEEGRNALVNNDHLARIGEISGLQKCCINQDGGPDEPSGYQLATAVEAIVAAVYLDAGRQMGRVEQVMDCLGLRYRSLRPSTIQGESPTISLVERRESIEDHGNSKPGPSIFSAMLRASDW